MDQRYGGALVKGYERLAAWSDLLDAINVFPVADADTGRNLRISLAPLRLLPERPEEASRRLLGAATGNAGNIAAAFLRPLVALQGPEELAAAVRQGAGEARRAVADPKPGTMLTLFDDLASALPSGPQAPSAWDTGAIVDLLEKTVAATAGILPEMSRAGVVDAGALGMFIFVETLLDELAGRGLPRPVTERFKEGLTLAERWHPQEAEGGYCVSSLVRSDRDPDEARALLSAIGRSVVVSERTGAVKVHLHTDDRDAVRRGLAQLGPVVSWQEERIATAVVPAARASQPVHVMTDAAGSIGAEDAVSLGITVLDSYLVVGDESWPETLVSPDTLYAAMAGGTRVSTAQASVFQRHQSYLSAVARRRHVLYLCVGSRYTGNFATATSWQSANDPEGRLAVLDTGTAAGRLGIVALVTARHAAEGHEIGAVRDFARAAVEHAQEFIFLDQLKFLAAGGRISKTQGLFGDLLRMKPVVSPLAEGAVKVGVVHRREDQLAFACRRLEALPSGSAPLILLQHSDNRPWVEEVAAREVRTLLPRASILVRPLSLTSGAHMGPGTWAVAFLPEAFNRTAAEGAA